MRNPEREAKIIANHNQDPVEMSASLARNATIPIENIIWIKRIKPLLDLFIIRYLLPA